MKGYFYCYSIQLKDFLKLQGIRFENKGKHPNGNIFWVFKYNDSLTSALDKWKIYKEILGKEK